jgi:hypothetical protein
MIELGDEVKDSVTGVKGIATARCEFLHGCTRVGVQPPIGKDGKIPDSVYFDEPQLVIIKKAKVKVEAKHSPRERGGPMPSIPTRHRDPK